MFKFTEEYSCKGEPQNDRKNKFKFSTRILNSLEIVSFDTFRLG